MNDFNDLAKPLMKVNEFIKQDISNEPGILALNEINKTLEMQNKIIEQQRLDLEKERRERTAEDKKTKKLTFAFSIINAVISITAVIVSVVLHFM